MSKKPFSAKLSLACLILAFVTALIASLLLYLGNTVWKDEFRGWGSLVYLVIVLISGLSIVGVLGLVSMISGMIIAKQHKWVLFWTIPWYLLFAAGITLLIAVQVAPAVGHWAGIPGGPDCSANIAAIFLGIIFILSLVYWMFDIFREELKKYLPLWSIPTIGIVLCLLIAILG